MKFLKLSRKTLGVIFSMMCIVYLIIYHSYKDVIYISVKIGREIVCKYSGSRATDEMSKSPPVILKTKFGLGNQLFQYAASYTIARSRNSDLYICLEDRDVPSNSINQSQSTQMKFNPNDRSYGLGHFKIPHDKLLIKRDGSDVTCESLLPTTSNHVVFSADDVAVAKCQIPANKIVKMSGYFESEIFFHQYKEDLLDMFVPVDEETMKKETEETLRLIEETESICVHVRRGDFDKQEGRRLPHSYYIEAMKFMEDELTQRPNLNFNRTFFIFSDDISDVAHNFGETINIDGKHINLVFASNGNFSRFNDLFLMTKCKHLIIANSTFSWWAAYLNRRPDKIVIAPMPKFKDTYTYWDHPYSQMVKKLEFYWSYPTSYRVIKPKFL